jgi:hypothetical protein
MSMFDAYPEFRLPLKEATSLVRSISKRIADAAEDVESQAADYERVQRELKPFRDVANLLTAQHFGLGIDDDQLLAIAHCILEEESKLSRDHQALLSQAYELARGRGFFHWDLEFPEAFIDVERGTLQENRGVDAVVGNPPYIRQEGLGKDKSFLQATYQVYSSAADLYVYFIERGVTLLVRNGDFGMITSNKFFRASYAAPLRQYLSGGVHLRQIVDFALLPVFPGITVRTAILLAENRESSGRLSQYAPVRSLDFAQLDDEVSTVNKELAPGSLGATGWSLASAQEESVLAKMESMAIELGGYSANEIRFGVKTGYNEAFIVDEKTRQQLISRDPQSIDVLKPLVVGRDISRYEIEFTDRYLVWTYQGVDIDRYPAVKDYLSRFREQLEQRWDKGEHWYELRPCSYYHEFKSRR